jgi:regulator of sigma E protease
MLIAIVVILGLAFLILIHEAGHFFAAKRLGMKVEEFGVGFPPRITSWKRGDTEYSLNWLPFGGFVRIAGENERLMDAEGTFDNTPEEEKKKLFYFRPAWQKSVVILAGVVMNFLIGWVLISAMFMIGTPHIVGVGEVEKDSPAAVAGLKEGDIIKGFETAQSFIDFTTANRGKEVTLNITRDTEEKTFTVMLRGNPTADQGALGVRVMEAGIDKEGPIGAIKDGFSYTVSLVKGTFLGFYDLLKNLITHATVPAGVVGPVGILGVAQSVAREGVVPFMQLLALISVNLAVLNLMPFPALDGGRFVMILIEKAKGSPISKKVEATVNGLGFAFLIILMLVITFRDVVHLF